MDIHFFCRPRFQRGLFCTALFKLVYFILALKISVASMVYYRAFKDQLACTSQPAEYSLTKGLARICNQPRARAVALLVRPFYADGIHEVAPQR